MQIALLATALFAVLWFVALKPKNDAAEPIAAAPVTTPAATSRPVDAGGASAQSAPGKAVESANNAVQASDAQTHAAEQQTGEETSAPSSAATSSASTSSAASSAAAATSSAASAPAATTPRAVARKSVKVTKKPNARSHAQRHADQVIEQVAKDLKARRAVIVLVYSKDGNEDRVVKARLAHQINRHGGKVRTYYVPVSQVGLYEGLLGTLNVGQTPSTIVIAPDYNAQVLGGLVGTARIDRLTSAALLIKPAASPQP